MAELKHVTDDGLPTPRRFWASGAIWFAIAMAVLDTAIANVRATNHRA